MKLTVLNNNNNLKVKVKVSTFVQRLIAGNLLLKRSGTAMRCQRISQFYLHTHAFIREWNEPYLPIAKTYNSISKTWTGLPVKESIRKTEDRYRWRKYVHGVANPRIEDGYCWSAWLSGRTSVSGQRSFAVLRSTYSWWVTTYVGKLSAILRQPTRSTRSTQAFIHSGSINE